MHSLYAAVKLLAAAATAVSAAGPSKLASAPLGRLQKYQDLQHERYAQVYNYVGARGQAEERQKKEPRFLNNQTQKFAVDSSALPDIDFDLGESYSGLLPIGNSSAADDDASLFFWFFPSADENVGKEIVLWFTGGPGCSSMSGLFEENGPVTWMPGTYKPIRNEWSWHQLSNVVWIDQPIGTGYTTGEPTAGGEEDVATQFRGFWKNFVDTFALQGYSVYITGESYGGMYCPYIAAGMLEQNDTEYYNVSGMLIYDGVYSGDPVSGDVAIAPFVDYWGGLFPFNDTFRADLEKRHADCGYADYLEKYLVFPPAGQQPTDESGDLPGIDSATGQYKEGCDMLNTVYGEALSLNPCFNIYQVGAGCPIPYDPLGFAGSSYYIPEGSPPVYFNRSEVKAALHVPAGSDWEMCKDGVFPTGDNSAPSSHFAIPRVIEGTENVILVHGALDMVLLANGSMLAIQNMTWGGQRGFQQRPADPLFVPYHPAGASQGSAAGAGVFGTTHSERGLTWAFVSLSGHMVPSNQPSVAYRQLEVLLGRVDGGLTSTAPFSTDADKTPQPDPDALGNGTAPQTWVSVSGSKADSMVARQQEAL
ncbi:hypothetical protein SLS62_001343 [Diatrype stigma]|uniref:Carboxypeptidase n=1 Tax=Diatrype stigma TaxID=117547 RepID=A0AAN9V8H8_9PEZI